MKGKKGKTAKDKLTEAAVQGIRREFLARISHELRTPLNGIIGMTELTLLTNLDYEQKENLNIVKTSANTLLKTINDILDFSQIEAGKITIEFSRFDIRELLEKTICNNLSKAAEKGLALSCKLDKAVPEFIYGDKDSLLKVLNYLMENAIKFTESGGVELFVSYRVYKNYEVEVEFLIRDTGIGIAPKKMSRLFKSFSQVDGSFTRKHGGMGLGLYISKELVEQMGGRIWVKSKEGRGSKFYFSLPQGRTKK